MASEGGLALLPIYKQTKRFRPTTKAGTSAAASNYHKISDPEPKTQLRPRPKPISMPRFLQNVQDQLSQDAT